MVTKTNNHISTLGKEVELLRSLVIGILGEDKEGEYRPAFVKKIFKVLQRKRRILLRMKGNYLNTSVKIHDCGNLWRSFPSLGSKIIQETTNKTC